MLKTKNVWKIDGTVIQSGNKAKLIMSDTKGIKLRTKYWLKGESQFLRAVTVLDFVRHKYVLIVSNNLRKFTPFTEGELFELEAGNEND